MTAELRLAAALIREHQQIDAGIDEFAAGLAEGQPQPEPLRTALAALRRHIYLEEEFLFPPIQEAGLAMPIQVMLHEHGHIWRALDSLDGLLADPTATEQRGDELLVGCRELLALLDQHNSKEEPIIYPRAEVDLGPEAGDAISEFLRSGTMPADWTCMALAGDAY